MPMKKRTLSCVLTLALAGCSGGGSGGGSIAPPSSNNSGPTTSLPPTNPLGRIVVNSVLLRAIPSNVDRLEFKGYDSAGNQVYGPESRAKAAQIILEGVPITVVQLEVEYYEGSILRGRGRQNVIVGSGQETVVNDPGFTDITYALTSLATPSSQIQLDRGQSQRLTVDGLYADNSRADVTSSVLWETTASEVAEVDAQGLLQARGIGRATLTGRVGSLSVTVQVQVNKPAVIGLAITPLDATVLEGGQLDFQAQALLADNTAEPVTPTQWSSSNTTAATINSDGQVQAGLAGNTRIQADYQDQHANTTLTVAADQTLYNFQISPADLRLPKGMTVAYKASASYANGTVVDLTALTQFSSSNTVVTDNEGTPPIRQSDWGVAPPPFFPNLPGSPQFHGNLQGAANITASYGSLSAQTGVTVVNTVPYRARVMPARAHLMNVGQSILLTTRTLMYDGTYEMYRNDAVIDSTPHLSVDAGLVATALSQGIDFLTARVPDPPFPNAVPDSASYSYSASIPPDYSVYSIEPAVAVISQALGIRFTQAQSTTGLTLLEDSAAGLVGIREGDNVLRLPASTLNLSNTNRLTGVGAGNFSGTAGRTEVFYAGRRANTSGADYGVVLRLISAGNPELVEFADEPSGIVAPRVADLDGDGRSDLAYLSGRTLKLRLSNTGVLQTLREVATVDTQGPLQLQTGDFNGDGRLDLAIAGANFLQVYLNDGGANFTALPSLTTPEGPTGTPYHLSSGDVDGDGRADLCYLTNRYAGNRYWTLFFGSSSGQLQNPVSGTTGYRVQSARLGDMTGDGKADLVTLQSSTGLAMRRTPRDSSIGIFPGGSQGFGIPQVIEVANTRAPLSLVLRRINGDALLDASVSAATDATVATTATVFNLTRQP
jgi:hypothetical protein